MCWPTGTVRGRAAACAIAASLAITACSSYAPAPLATRSDLASDLAGLTVPPVAPAPEGWPAHRFDPSNGLDSIEIATLAVANNPDLRAARASLGVSQAQAFAAGLLPDPQLSLSRDFPFSTAAGVTSAFNLGLGFDFSSLLTRPAAERAARSELQGARLSLLWQEWQVVGQARLLFSRALAADRGEALLRAQRALLAERDTQARRALARGDMTVDVAAGYRAALDDVDRQLSELERARDRGLEDLNALLGLRAGTRLKLVDDATAGGAPVDAAAVAARLRELPQRRPDLLALQAGYAAQDQRLRQAILAQFPALNLGLSRARDTAGLQTRGFTLGLTLPVFNRNRGNIAIESATRAKLRAEYQTRLDAAQTEIERILLGLPAQTARLEQVDAGLRFLEPAADAAQRAFKADAIDVLTYTNLQAAVLAKRQEAAALRQSIDEQDIALQTLLGGTLPSGPDHTPLAKPTVP
ncbi:MAG: TolC family protein [Burkholderiales bacterium]|nr:TolC family protein [Burkholderiales bacterium]